MEASAHLWASLGREEEGLSLSHLHVHCKRGCAKPADRVPLAPDDALDHHPLGRRLEQVEGRVTRAVESQQRLEAWWWQLLCGDGQAHVGRRLR